jgi:hypothetical protein
MKKMYEEGGLATDGMDVDPVSGNDIPTGSNAEDVRDDVDAKLSSGEYVVPADVVKYLGVAQLEKLVDKAKMGLEDMAENGRIGGAPVDEPEEVVMTLGGDLGTLDGYATGGMVEGTDIDGIIDRVKGAAMKDPSILNMLKAKGIFVDAGQPAQATPPAVQGQNDVPAAFAEGGLTGEYDASNFKSDFNPYAYTPGFSAETDVTGAAPGQPSAPSAPVCPEGSTWDAAQNMCVPDALTAPTPTPVERSSDNVNNGAAGVLDRTDPNSWMEKFDYSNPETLFENTMSTIGGGQEEEEEGKPKGLLGGALGLAKGVFAGGIIGKFMATTNAAQAAANSIVLRDMGRGDLADKIDAQYGTYVKDSGIELVPEAWRDGDRLATSIKENKSEAINSWGKAPKKPVNGTAGLGARKMSGPSDTWTQTSSPNAAKAAKSLGSKSSESTSSKMLKGMKDAQKIAETAAKTGKTIAEVGRAKASSTVERKETDSDKAAKKAGATRSGGGREFGMAKGGLVSPKTPAKPKAKKTTNKKGLGRK